MGVQSDLEAIRVQEFMVVVSLTYYYVCAHYTCIGNPGCGGQPTVPDGRESVAPLLG